MPGLPHISFHDSAIGLKLFKTYERAMKMSKNETSFGKVTQAQEDFKKLQNFDLLRYLDSDKGQCVLLSAESHACTAFQKKVQTIYRKQSPPGSSIPGRYQEYQTRGNHYHMSGHGSSELRKERINRTKTTYF